MKNASWSFTDAPRDASATVSRAARLLHERFEVIGFLGSGGSGSVYRARERASGRELAVKVLHGRDAAAKTRLFKREGALTAALDHPGIVKIHSAGELKGCSYLAYELIEGCSPLEAAPGEAGRQIFVERLRRAAEAVGFAHARGVVHRDLKPENILVDRDGQVRVTDFGLAWTDGADSLTKTGALVGTPHYMAPEALRAADADQSRQPQIDVWGLGAILYEGLTGLRPFPADSLVVLLGQIMSDRLVSPRAIDPSISTLLERVCLTALALDPADRYTDASSFAAALGQACLEPPSTHRARAVALSAAVLGLVLVVALLITAWAIGPSTPTPATALRPDPVVPSPTPLSEARALLRAGRGAEALDLLERQPDPPGQLLGRAFVLEAERLVREGRPDLALALSRRPALARVLRSERALGPERLRLAERSLSTIRPFGPSNELEPARHVLVSLQLALRLSPPDASWSPEAIATLGRVSRDATQGATTLSRAARLLRYEVLLVLAVLASRQPDLLRELADRLRSVLRPEDGPAQIAALRRVIGLPASDRTETSDLRFMLCIEIFKQNESDAEAIQLASALLKRLPAFERAHPRWLLLLQKRFRARYAQRQWTAALRDADEGVRLRPADRQWAARRAIALSKLGRFDEAAQVAWRLVDVRGKDPRPHAAACEVLWAIRTIRPPQPRRLLAAFRHLVTVHPDRARTVTHRIGWLELELGQAAAASKTIRKAAELNQGWSEAGASFASKLRTLAAAIDAGEKRDPLAARFAEIDAAVPWR